MRPISVLTLLFMSLLVAGCENKNRDPTVIFSGICDGSAAVRVGREQLLIASDEANALYLFNSEGGVLIHSFQLTDLLRLPHDSEMDLEAAVVHDNGIWWIGSHGRDASADDAPNRRVLFQTSVPSAGSKDLTLKTEIHDVSHLLSKVVSDPALARAPKKGGINIEGLSVTSSGDLLIALRSPLSNAMSGDAFVLQITMRDEMFELVDSFRLALGDRGVRDIVITDNGYLLIAGEVASGGDFSVFRWWLTGELKELFKVPQGFNAEALVDMGEYWLLLSDDGKVTRPDDEAKDGDRACEDIISKNSKAGSNSSVFLRGLSFVP